MGLKRAAGFAWVRVYKSNGSCLGGGSLSDSDALGRNPEDLAREFQPTAQSIRNWVVQADLDEGRRSDGLTTDDRAELSRLRRENLQLRVFTMMSPWF